MTLPDMLGLVGVALLLAAYALGVAGRLDPRRPRALAMNFAGASLILLSLMRDFNLSAALIEAAWALIALIGLVRALLSGPADPPQRGTS